RSAVRCSVSKITSLLLMSALLVRAQDEADRRRAAEIQEKIRNNQPVAAEDRAFMQQMQQRRNAEWAKTHPRRDSTGLTPLPDLGKGIYKGEQGGLYPGGENMPPPSHAKAGLKIAGEIRPLDVEGRESANGKIVMVSTGMSNTTQESQALTKLLERS